MERTTTRLRRLIERPGLIVAPACFDPLTARIAAELGFECVALGGYALGSHLAASEPLLTMTEAVIVYYADYADSDALMLEAGRRLLLMSGR